MIQSEDEKKYQQETTLREVRHQQLKTIRSAYFPGQSSLAGSLKRKWFGEVEKHVVSKATILDVIYYYFPKRAELEVHVLDFGPDKFRKQLVRLTDIEDCEYGSKTITCSLMVRRFCQQA